MRLSIFSCACWLFYYPCCQFQKQKLFIKKVSAKALQSCPALCDPTDCSLLGSSVHRILQARILEWVVMASSRGSSWPRDGTHTCFVSCIRRRVFATEPPEKPYKELPTMKCLWPLPCQKIKTKFLKLVLRMTRIYLVESAIMLPPYPLGHILWSQFDSSLSDHLWSFSKLFSPSSLPFSVLS